MRNRWLRLRRITAASARNLLHCLSVRQRDIRPLQLDLHSLGLSSLGVLEGYVLASINAVVSNLEALANEAPEPAPAPPATFTTGPILLHDHPRRLFGPAPGNPARARKRHCGATVGIARLTPKRNALLQCSRFISTRVISSSGSCCVRGDPWTTGPISKSQPIQRMRSCVPWHSSSTCR
jgi:hypothetical protein